MTNNNIIKTDIIIIGAGPVGIFASFCAGMLGMKSHIIDILESPGGQCSILYPEKPIYDIPAYPKITGQGLVDRLLEQASPFNPEFHLSQQVVSFKTEQDNSLTVRTNKDLKINARAILIAGGVGAFQPNKPPLENIELYESKSIFYHITNKNLFQNKKIAIAGGGDSAIDWAIELAEIAQETSIIHRRNKFRCLPESQVKLEQLIKLGKINLVTPYQLHEISGENGMLNSLTAKDLDGNIKHLQIDYLLPFFGLANELGPLKDWGLQLNHKQIQIDQSTSQTNIPGIYAIGDIAHYPGKLKLIMLGFSEAALALHHCYERVKGKALHFEHSTTKGIEALI